ncbi:hypothetical protein PFISCL1PPCAC_14760, partial [Pristionchus fissidentatus]
IQIIDYLYWWQIFSIVILILTLTITLIVFIGAIAEKPIIGYWNKKRVIISYSIALLFILISVGLQTWTCVYARSDSFYFIRYVVSTSLTWLIVVSWIGFMISLALTYK